MLHVPASSSNAVKSAAKETISIKNGQGRLPGVAETANEIRRRVGISAISALLLAVSATTGFSSHSEECYIQ
jgi:hypothetical protein